MAGRPRGDEGVIGLFCDNLVNGMYRTAHGAQRRLESAGRHRGIAVEMGEAFLGGGVAQLRDVIHRVTQRDGFERGERRLDARERLELFSLKGAFDGAQPVRPLGVAARHQMIETGGVAKEKR